jgi:IMP dehydrogenase
MMCFNDAYRLAINSPVGLTYNDVQVVPQYSNATSRANIETKTKLVEGIYIDTPIIPANMDSIAGLEMAKVCHDMGTVCFFHRFSTTNDLIRDVEEYLDYALSSGKKNILVGISVGVNEDDVHDVFHVHKRINELNSGVKLVVLIDVAHGDHVLVERQINLIKSKLSVPVIAGNVATGDAAYRLAMAGADGIKVGVGPGSLCSTRIQTGAGVPQFTAIVDVYLALSSVDRDVTIIADGGLKFSGDIVKAIGAGANSVMTGYLFAGTDATPGEIIRETYPYGSLSKIYRGSASRESKRDRGESNHIEGVATKIAYQGETRNVFIDCLDGIRSGLSYAGFNKLEDSVAKMKFVRVSQSSIVEASPNGA